MQGFILSKVLIKNQDLILRVLTPSKILELYRFYGARHSILDQGRKIDFETQHDGYFLPKMRHILQLSYPWEAEYARVYVWKSFIAMLHAHLKEISAIESFYFELLDWGAHILSKQHPMRVGIEMGVKLLHFEGRSMRADQCFICEAPLGPKVALARALLVAHPDCIRGFEIEKSKLFDLLHTGSTLHLQDCEVEEIWNVFTQGL